MATRITGGTLTVTITESLTMTHATSADNRTHSQTVCPASFVASLSIL